MRSTASECGRLIWLRRFARLLLLVLLLMLLLLDGFCLLDWYRTGVHVTARTIALVGQIHTCGTQRIQCAYSLTETTLLVYGGSFLLTELKSRGKAEKGRLRKCDHENQAFIILATRTELKEQKERNSLPYVGLDQ